MTQFLQGLWAKRREGQDSSRREYVSVPPQGFMDIVKPLEDAVRCDQVEGALDGMGEMLPVGSHSVDPMPKPAAGLFHHGGRDVDRPDLGIWKPL